MGTTIVDYDVLVNWALLPQQQAHRIEKDSATYVWRDGIVEALFAAGKLDDENYPYLISYLDNGRAKHGLGSQLELMPPDVPFGKRGVYYMIVEMPTEQAIFEAAGKLSALDIAQKSYSKPEEILYHNIAYDEIIRRLYPGVSKNSLDTSILEYIHPLIVPAMLNVGWLYEKNRTHFMRPMKLNRTNHDEMNSRFDGHRHSQKYFFFYVAYDAYGGEFHFPEHYYSDEFREYVAEMAEKYGYVRKDDYYQPKPIELPASIKEMGAEILSSANYLQTSKLGYQCIPLRAIRIALDQRDVVLNQQQIIDQLLGSQGAWRSALILNGFRHRAKEQLRDNYPNLIDVTGYRFDAIVKLRRLGGDDVDRKVAFAAGFPVMIAGIAVDSSSGDMVFLDMVGSKNAIKANWAALVQNNRYFSFSQVRFKIGSAQNHTFYRQPLPSGLYQMIIINNSGLPKNLDPTVDVGYIITNERDNMPEHFFATLDKMLEIPILPEWAEYLWVTGRALDLISYVGNPNKQIGITAWKIRGSDNWMKLIETAIAAKSISIT